MAHMITDRDGIATGRGIVPWHGLGVTIPGVMTPFQAIQHAKLDWAVSLQELVCKHPDFSALTIPSRAVVRMDTQEVLGVVGERFTPIQNVDLVSILDAVVENGARIDTAGSLMGGRVVWFAAVLGDYEAAGEAHRDFLVISHGHDGGRAVTIRRTTIRVVCWNTLCYSDQDRASDFFSVRHTESAQTRVGAIGRLIAGTQDRRAAFQDAARRMAGKRLTEKEQVEFVLRCLNLDPTLEIESIRRKIEAAKAALMWEMEMSRIPDPNLWTAFQGVTHYLEHETASKGSTTDAGKERRLASTLLDGDRAQIASKAFSKALALV